jgi:branched-chain amino acid transport system ATP-binding protein
MLEVRHLSATYGVIPVLHDVSFKVDRDEIVTLLGSNGAGKSTILNCIQGIMRATSGEIFFNGKNITGWPSHKIVAEGVIHIPEGHRIFPYFSVRENLLLGAYPGNAWKSRRKSLERASELFPILLSRADQQSRLLSGGEQQMLCIGRALMSNPRFIMVDEPSVGLAPVVVDGVFEALVKLKAQGITILLPEQNALRALEIADRAYVIQHGRIIMEGDSDQLMKSDTIKKAYLGR